MLVAQASGYGSCHADHTDGFLATQHRHDRDRAIAAHQKVAEARPKRSIRLGLRVRNIDKHGVENRRAVQTIAGERGCKPVAPSCDHRGIVVRNRRRPHKLAIGTRDGDQRTREQPTPAAHDRLEYRLRVRRGASDYSKDVRGRRLPLQRFLGFVEEARVLDRDHRLVGEGFEQRDLIVRECGPPRHGDRANCLRASDHRYDQ